MRLLTPVIGILRGIDFNLFGDVMQASFAAGLEAIEVTMNTNQAERIVREHLPLVPEGKILGMGTIRNITEAKKALDAGAMFLVSPNFDPEVIELATNRNIPVIAGAATPSETYAAWSAGASMVKIFPCRSLGGPDYIRQLRGPFDQIPLVAVGGVGITNASDYFAAGAAAVGVGDSLFGKDAMRKRDMGKVLQNVKMFIKSCRPSQDRV